MKNAANPVAIPNSSQIAQRIFQIAHTHKLRDVAIALRSFSNWKQKQRSRKAHVVSIRFYVYSLGISGTAKADTFQTFITYDDAISLLVLTCKQSSH